MVGVGWRGLSLLLPLPPPPRLPRRYASSVCFKLFFRRDGLARVVDGDGDGPDAATAATVAAATGFFASLPRVDAAPSWLRGLARVSIRNCGRRLVGFL